MTHELYEHNQDELSQASRSLRAPTPQPTMATPGASVPSSPARPANLLDLPDELIHIILTFLDGRTALLLEAASPRFAGPCASPSLWRAYCVREYIYWDRRHSPRAQRRRPAGEVQWKEMYLYRGLGDQRVASIFNDVVGRQTKRYERYARIAAGYGNDAKDFLLRMTRADERSHPEDWLARR
ncbi:hypothetical protein KEM55_001180 [Ascosphaera atra]|nr:hypothetical protein KEM55_001180 [Ascosphaera atra]